METATISTDEKVVREAYRTAEVQKPSFRYLRMMAISGCFCWGKYC